MKNLRIKIIFVLLIAAIFIVLLLTLRQTDNLKQSISVIKSAELSWLILAFLAMISTYFAATFTLKSLAIKNISFSSTMLIQIAGGLATKIVPSGLGGIALNVRYLQVQRHSLVQAGTVVTVNNTLGFIGHLCIIGLVVISLGFASPINISFSRSFLITGTLVLAVIFLGLIIWGRKSKRIKNIIRELKSAVILYSTSPQKLLFGFIGAVFITLFYAICLWCCAKSLGLGLLPIEVLWVLTFGLVGSTLSPTPGGLGGAEAALTAALMSLGLGFAEAFAISLLYRLITYWLQIIFGLPALHYALKNKYL